MLTLEQLRAVLRSTAPPAESRASKGEEAGAAFVDFVDMWHHNPQRGGSMVDVPHLSPLDAAQCREELSRLKVNPLPHSLIPAGPPTGICSSALVPASLDVAGAAAQRPALTMGSARTSAVLAGGRESELVATIRANLGSIDGLRASATIATTNATHNHSGCPWRADPTHTCGNITSVLASSLRAVPAVTVASLRYSQLAGGAVAFCRDLRQIATTATNVASGSEHPPALVLVVDGLGVALCNDGFQACDAAMALTFLSAALHDVCSGGLVRALASSGNANANANAAAGGSGGVAASNQHAQRQPQQRHQQRQQRQGGNNNNNNNKHGNRAANGGAPAANHAASAAAGATGLSSAPTRCTPLRGFHVVLLLPPALSLANRAQLSLEANGHGLVVTQVVLSSPFSADGAINSRVEQTEESEALVGVEFDVGSSADAVIANLADTVLTLHEDGDLCSRAPSDVAAGTDVCVVVVVPSAAFAEQAIEIAQERWSVSPLRVAFLHPSIAFQNAWAFTPADDGSEEESGALRLPPFEVDSPPLFVFLVRRDVPDLVDIPDALFSQRVRLAGIIHTGLDDSVATGPSSPLPQESIRRDCGAIGAALPLRATADAAPRCWVPRDALESAAATSLRARLELIGSLPSMWKRAAQCGAGAVVALAESVLALGAACRCGEATVAAAPASGSGSGLEDREAKRRIISIDTASLFGWNVGDCEHSDAPLHARPPTLFHRAALCLQAAGCVGSWTRSDRGVWSAPLTPVGRIVARALLGAVHPPSNGSGRHDQARRPFPLGSLFGIVHTRLLLHGSALGSRPWALVAAAALVARRALFPWPSAPHAPSFYLEDAEETGPDQWLAHCLRASSAQMAVPDADDPRFFLRSVSRTSLQHVLLGTEEAGLQPVSDDDRHHVAHLLMPAAASSGRPSAGAGESAAAVVAAAAPALWHSAFVAAAWPFCSIGSSHTFLGRAPRAVSRVDAVMACGQGVRVPAPEGIGSGVVRPTTHSQSGVLMTSACRGWYCPAEITLTVSAASAATPSTASAALPEKVAGGAFGHGSGFASGVRVVGGTAGSGALGDKSGVRDNGGVSAAGVATDCAVRVFPSRKAFCDLVVEPRFILPAATTQQQQQGRGGLLTITLPRESSEPLVALRVVFRTFVDNVAIALQSSEMGTTTAFSPLSFAAALPPTILDSHLVRTLLGVTAASSSSDSANGTTTNHESDASTVPTSWRGADDGVGAWLDGRSSLLPEGDPGHLRHIMGPATQAKLVAAWAAPSAAVTAAALFNNSHSALALGEAGDAAGAASRRIRLETGGPFAGLVPPDKDRELIEKTAAAVRKYSSRNAGEAMLAGKKMFSFIEPRHEWFAFYEHCLRQ